MPFKQASTPTFAGPGGADALVRADTLGPAIPSKNRMLATIDRPTWASAAVRGDRPTKGRGACKAADSSGIGRKRLNYAVPPLNRDAAEGGAAPFNFNVAAASGTLSPSPGARKRFVSTPCCRVYRSQ